jgi:Uma2 family endonuclease
MENEVNEALPKYNWITPEEYLEMEKYSEQKHQYHQGKVLLMAGTAPSHNVIAYNLSRLIAPMVHARGCKLFGSDFRVFVEEQELFTYPDFSIVCGKAVTAAAYPGNLINPKAIIEILSSSTREYDRGMKFNYYKSIPGFQEYLLVDSTRTVVERFQKEANGLWSASLHTQLPETVRLLTAGIPLLLADIYEDVQL